MLKNTHAKKPYTPTILLPWILIAVGLLIACFTITFSLWRTNNQPPKLASREDVAKLQTIVADIKSKLDDDRAEWRDNSSCTIIEPRLFGEVERYYCVIQYDRSVTVENDTQIRRQIGQQAKILRTANYVVTNVHYPTFDIDTNDQYKVKQAGGLDMEIHNDHEVAQNCAISYTLETSTKTALLNQRIRCYVDTKASYLKRVDRV